MSLAISKTCAVCCKEFRSWPSETDRRCCSAECANREIVQCPGCGETFVRGYYRRVYCTEECRDRAQYCRKPPRRETVTCSVCGDTYERWKASRPGRCPSCMYPRGEQNPQWKGGESFNKATGRWIARRPDGTTTYRYRYVMEQHLGRRLGRREQVHHINGDRTDDRLENLQLMAIEEHSRLHATVAGWSRKHERCVECGTTERKHGGHGLCVNCYVRQATCRRAAVAA